MNQAFFASLFKSLYLPVDLYLKVISLNFCEAQDLIRAHKKIEKSQWLEVLKNNKLIQEQLSGYNILYPSHDLYPKAFYELKQPPVFLCALGNVRFLNEHKLTVIGSRRPLVPFSEWMSDQFLQFLKKENVVTVSGGAFGVDQIATQIALFCNRPSIVILPSGLQVSYPRHTKAWLSDKNILSLTEYFPFESVRNYHFVNRNRLLGSLSPQVLVVQCAVKSGTMTTVKAALEMGRDVFTLPSFPGLVESSGNIQLLKDGAQLIASSEDLSLALRLFSPHPNCEY